MQYFTLFLGIFALLSVSSQSSHAQSTWNNVYTVLQAKCSSCHNSAVASGGLNLSGTAAEVYDQLVEVTPDNAAAAAKGQKRIDKGYPYRSFLMRKIGQGMIDPQDDGLLTEEEGAYMPAYPATDDLTNAERELIRQWIYAGAPETGSPVNESVINEYYALGGVTAPDRPEAPDPSEGFQIHLGPIFLPAAEEKEYSIKYALNLPSNIEVKAIDTRMSQESHHFILYEWNGNASNNAEDGLREITLFSNNPFLEDNKLVSVWQYSERQQLPAGTAFKWSDNAVLDLNFHVANYSGTQILPAHVYINVYTQPNGTALKEMRSELMFYQGPTGFGFFTIPSNTTNYVLEEPINNAQQWNIWTVSPHTHSRGVDFDLFYLNSDNTTPGEQIFEGTENGVYDWAHPPIQRYEPFIDLPANAGLFQRATFTNLSSSPVTFGLTTENEMMITILQYTEGDPIPFVGIPLVENQYCYEQPALNFVPAGGIASGNGVVDGQFIPALAGEGTHTITYSYPYEGENIVAEYQITVLPPLAAPTISQTNGVLSVPYTYDTFQWLLNGVAIAGATQPNYTPTTNGEYSIQLSLGGCTTTTESYQVISSVADLSHRLSFLAAPNPYTDQINIQYTLPNAAQVQIALYNTLGQRVAQIAATQQTGGTHTHQLDGTQLPEGVYWLQLSVGSETITRKIQKM